MKNNRKKSKIKALVTSHLSNNKREYIIMLILLVIGILLGVLFINKVQEDQFKNISNYISNFVEKLKTIENINFMNLLKNSLFQNLGLAIILWFFGTTVIRNTSSFWYSGI